MKGHSKPEIRAAAWGKRCSSVYSRYSCWGAGKTLTENQYSKSQAWAVESAGLSLLTDTGSKCASASVLLQDWTVCCRALCVTAPVPVAYTRASFSPCLTVEPEKATLPLNFLAGRDSPVRAAWSICSRTGHKLQ